MSGVRPDILLFKSGVLFSSFHLKGDILIMFLQKLKLVPKKVIFIDDEFEHVQSVVTCLDKQGISCLGIHYTAANEAPCDLDSEQARLQINYFIEYDIWLSDKDSKQLLKKYIKQENYMPFTILPFDSKYQSEVIDLIERIQVGEFSIPIEEAQRKELQSISQSFQKNKGNYWVAIFNGKVIGTIAVMDIGHNAFELRDVFLDQEYRGPKTGFAKKLLDTVLSWSNEHKVKTIFLGTTLNFKAAHRFYKKHGFREIVRRDMPTYCQPMDCDEKFYRLDL